MKKKSIVILSVLIAALLLFTGYKMFLAPKGVEGAKEVTIEVVNEEEGIDERFTYDTDHEFLLELMEEKQEELGASFEESEFGKMVVGMMNYIANPNKQEFFHISINGEDAMTGVEEIPLEDGDVYRFELTNY